MRWVGAGLLLGLVLTGCTITDNFLDVDAEILGTWQMVIFSQDGLTVAVEEDVNAARVPYVEIDTSLRGSGGCNDFESVEEGFSYSDGELNPGETIFNASLCDPEELNLSESALRELLWSGVTISVSFEADQMLWSQDEKTVTWVKIDGPPPPPTIPPRTAFGPLDCGSDEMLEESVDAATGGSETLQESGEALISAHPQVASYEQFEANRLIWFGYDESGDATVVVAFQDISPEFFKIYTCP